MNKHLDGHEPIVENQIGLTQTFDGTQRQQAGMTGASTDERNE